MTDFKEKFIAFVDILGFKSLVEASEAGTGLSVEELSKLLESFGSPDIRDRLEKLGPICCPESKYIERNLDFRLSQVSDCAVISTEISPAGAINLIHHCWGTVLAFLERGIMCRGYITRGRIHHAATQFPIGTGYHNAYAAEGQVSFFKRQADERGTPFVEVDRVVCDYLRETDDSCIKEMFSRFTKSDGDTVALFPFQRLAHSFVIGGFGQKFDPEKEKKSNENLHRLVGLLKERVMTYVDRSNPSAVRKSEHYINALKAQLAVCDRTDKTIDMLCSPRG